MLPRKKKLVNSNNDEIESVKVSDRCLESRPCQHEVTIKFKNGQTETSTMRSPDIEKKYGKYIPYANSHGSIWKKYPENFAENIKAYEETQQHKLK